MTIPALTGSSTTGPAGRNLILGPSLGTSSILWDRAIPILAEEFTVLAWDLPGHGNSAATGDPFSMADLADGVIRLADDAGFDTFRYAGVSLAGQVGLELALRHPDRLLGMAIICSTAKIGEQSGWDERAATVRTQGTPVMVGGSAARWFAPGFIEREPESASALLHALSDTDDESYALCCEALGRSDTRGRLGEISAPTIAIYGEADTVISAADAELVAAGVQHGEALRIDGAAHLPPIEQPEAVAEALIDFFGTEAR